MCAQDAEDYYAWAKEDPRVVAIAPWNYNGCPACNGSRWTGGGPMDELGAKVQPLTLAAWEKIGAEIKSKNKNQTVNLSPAAGTYRGSNNWLSFCGNVNETKLLSSAAGQATQLLPFGYDLYGLDAGWSTCMSGDCNPVSPDYHDPKCCGLGHGMDAYGRPLPKPDLFPSSGPHGELGLKPIIDKLHSMGLKFQLRMERGIAIEAVQQKVPIFGTNFTADEIADLTTSCGAFGKSGGWGGSFAGMNLTHPGSLAYVQSVVDLWCEWGVDAIEADDYFGGQPGVNPPATHSTNW